MNDFNPRAVIGNNEPPLADRLALDHAELVKEATEKAALAPESIRAIETDEEAAAYTDTAVAINEVLAQANAAFKVEKAPWLAGGQTVQDFFAFRATLDAAVKRVRRALDDRANAIMAAKKRAEAEEASRAKAAAEAETERLRREALAFDEPPPPVVAPVYTAPAPLKDVARVVSAATGNKASVGTKWIAEVVDPALVPRQYLIAYQPLIDAAVKGGIREIPGVRIYETAKTAFRR